jgi:hypothetical protein
MYTPRNRIPECSLDKVRSYVHTMGVKYACFAVWVTMSTASRYLSCTPRLMPSVNVEWWDGGADTSKLRTSDEHSQPEAERDTSCKATCVFVPSASYVLPLRSSALVDPELFAANRIGCFHRTKDSNVPYNNLKACPL